MFVRYSLPNMEEARRHMNQLVLYVFLPALIFNTVMKSKIDFLFIEIPLVAATTIIVSLLVGFVFFNFLPVSGRTKGAILLGASFGNVTYLGIPVLMDIFPDRTLEVTEVAVLYEITTSFLNLSLGAMIAVWYSSHEKVALGKVLIEAVKLPPIWAVLVAVFWKITKAPCPDFMLQATHILAMSVSGIMILSLGMALRIKPTSLIALVLPVAAIKLFLSPAITAALAPTIGVSGIYKQASVVESAMPSQLLSFVIASKYRLDEETLAFVITADTILSFLTIPILSSLSPS
jgi:malate permease and related proteins